MQILQVTLEADNSREYWRRTEEDDLVPVEDAW